MAPARGTERRLRGASVAPLGLPGLTALSSMGKSSNDSPQMSAGCDFTLAGKWQELVENSQSCCIPGLYLCPCPYAGDSCAQPRKPASSQAHPPPHRPHRPHRPHPTPAGRGDLEAGFVGGAGTRPQKARPTRKPRPFGPARSRQRQRIAQNPETGGGNNHRNSEHPNGTVSVPAASHFLRAQRPSLQLYFPTGHTSLQFPGLRVLTALWLRCVHLNLLALGEETKPARRIKNPLSGSEP